MIWKKRVYRTSDDLFFLIWQTLIGLTRENYLSSRNYRNRWRGYLKKNRTRGYFFYVAQVKSRVRENVTTRFAITLRPRGIAAPWRSKLSRLTPQLKRFRNAIAETRGCTIFVYNKSLHSSGRTQAERVVINAAPLITQFNV